MASNISILASALSDDARDAAQLARRMGFDGMQFDAVSAMLDLTSLSGTGRREFLRVLSSNDQQLAGLRWQVGPKGFRPGADVDRVLARLAKVLETAAGLQTPLVCLDLGPLPEPAVNPKPKTPVTPQMAGLIILPTAVAVSAKPPFGSEPQGRRQAETPPDPAFVSQLDAAMAQLGQTADRFNVMLAMRSDLASFAAIEAALARVACPWFGVDLDPVAILRDAWEIDEIFSRLGPHIRHVRGRDAIVGADRRTMPAVIGDGSTNWPQLLLDLDGAGFRGWITIDPLELPDRPAAATAGLAVLRKI